MTLLEEEAEAILRAALAAINAGREALGWGRLQGPMPKGIRYDTTMCPIAQCFHDGGFPAAMGRVALTLPQATDEQVHRLQEAWRSRPYAFGWPSIYVPHAIADFRRAFDAGRYPALELP